MLQLHITAVPRACLHTRGLPACLPVLPASIVMACLPVWPVLPVQVHNGAVAGTTSEYMSLCNNLHIPHDSSIVILEYR